MSHYNVDASVPKTLIAFLVRWVAANEDSAADAAPTLLAIAETKISPELVPGVAGDEGPSQSTEDTIGPFELHDFFLYYLARFGYRPSRILALAEHAWSDAGAGRSPELIPVARRHAYQRDRDRPMAAVFWSDSSPTSSSDRPCPTARRSAPAARSRPGANWRAPSDVDATIWLAELDAHLAKPEG